MHLRSVPKQISGMNCLGRQQSQGSSKCSFQKSSKARPYPMAFLHGKAGQCAQRSRFLKSTFFLLTFSLLTNPPPLTGPTSATLR